MEPNTASLGAVLVWQCITIIIAFATLACVVLLIAMQHDRIRYGHIANAYLEWTFGLALGAIAGFGLTMIFWLEMPTVAS